MSYTCENCHRSFIKEWDDQDAKAEFNEYFPEQSFEAAALVCDDCYRMIFGVEGTT